VSPASGVLKLIQETIMASRDSGPAPADVVALVLSPVLIMALVGSLVFFLLEVLYAGAHPGRIQWVLFFFVFGAVLVARISMQADIASRAFLYGGVLALVAFIALLQYVIFPSHLEHIGPLVSLGLVVIIWWSTYRLTWDCTFMDDRVGAAGQGVLQAAGLDQQDAPSLERYRQKKKSEEPSRTPGVWVIYFSLAALPLFGLGQSLIPPDETARRRYTFWLMAIYTGCGLGLLLTTSFLGLRLYLRQRNLRMPPTMTAVWLTLGGILVACLLAGSALLPRPLAEVKVVDIDPLGSAQRKATKKNVKEGEPGEGEGEAEKGQPEKDLGKPNDKGQTKDREAGNQGEKDKKDDRAGGRGKDDREKDKGKDRGGRQNGDGERQKEGEAASNAPSSPPPSGPSWLKDAMPILKKLVFVLLGLIFLFVVLRGLLRFAAGSSNWARNLLSFLQRLWESLWGLFRQPEKTSGEVSAEEVESLSQQPFETFSNPFEDGRADSMSPATLIRYTFAALEAWARERQLGRQKGETPLELAARVGEELPALERESARLAQLYALAVYGRGGLPANTREVLKRFWDVLERATEQPLSA
jgi:hypothetical protein